MDEPEDVVADDKLLLRIEEAAKRLGIGRSLMYRLVLAARCSRFRLAGFAVFRRKRCESTSSGCGSRRRASRRRRS